MSEQEEHLNCNGRCKHKHTISRYVCDTPKGVDDPLGFTYQALDIYWCDDCGKTFIGTIQDYGTENQAKQKEQERIFNEQRRK